MDLEDAEDVEGGDLESDPHPSGISFVKISLWRDGDYPGSGDPDEAVGINLRDGEKYAIGDGEVGTAQEWIEMYVDHQLSEEGNGQDD